MHGYHILRFKNAEVLENLETVLLTITHANVTPSPGRQAGGMGEGGRGKVTRLVRDRTGINPLQREEKEEGVKVMTMTMRVRMMVVWS